MFAEKIIYSKQLEQLMIDFMNIDTEFRKEIMELMDIFVKENEMN